MQTLLAARIAVFTIIAPIAGLVLCPTVAEAIECSGDELICADLTDGRPDAAENAGGNFGPGGYQPSDRGGLVWRFNAAQSARMTAGRLSIRIRGLLPVEGPELGGGKVSLLSLCGIGGDDNEYIGLQKMPADYRDGHIFRYGMDDDGLADNWDAVVITGRGFGCRYSIADPAWQPEEEHRVVIDWGPDGVRLRIDGSIDCFGRGNGDTFDPARGSLVLGNRCEHQRNQHAQARFSEVRLQAWGDAEAPDPDHEPSPDPDPQDDGCDVAIRGELVGSDLVASPETTLTVRYHHCRDADELRIVQVAVADAIAAGAPMVGFNYDPADNLLQNGDQECQPGGPGTLELEHGWLNCAASSIDRPSLRELVVRWAVGFDAPSYAGDKGVFVDAKDFALNRLGWLELGRLQITEPPDPPADETPADESPTDALPEEEPPHAEPEPVADVGPTAGNGVDDELDDELEDDSRTVDPPAASGSVGCQQFPALVRSLVVPRR